MELHRPGKIRLSPACPAEPAMVEFRLRIENWWQILAAYGEKASRDVRVHISALFRDLIGARGEPVAVNDWIFAADEWLDVRLPDQMLPARDCGGDGWIKIAQALCSAAAVRPCVCDGTRIHVALSWHLPGFGQAAPPSGQVDVIGTPDLAGATSGSMPENIPARFDSDWARRYRADMAEAGGLLAMIGKDELELAWQAVWSASDPCEILHYEALLRSGAKDGETASPFGAICALERLGLVRELDRRVVDRVLDQLEANPSVVLAANISARSAVLDQWWAGIECRLLDRRDVACRFIIEITETAEIHPSEATLFSNRMRSLGCRIALDDFGVGFASIRRLMAMSPDIVKIDAYFMRRANQSERDWKIFMHVVALAQAISPLVIVEGVETEAQRRLAEEAGVRWLQGYLGGLPTAIRTWRGTADDQSAKGLPGFREKIALSRNKLAMP